ncbi:carboxymuconolactone decarboxylase family protein [soil metagenome]
MVDNVPQAAGRDAAFELGAETFSRVMGQPAESFLQTVDGLAPGYGRLILETEFGIAYNRPGLDPKTRELVIIASCASLGVTGHGAVRTHIPAALNLGATREEIVEVFVQIGFGAGLPTALAALEVAQQAFAAIDAAA